MITLNELTIGYDKPLIGPINMAFEDGAVYGILGKSGCGKSTLLKTISKMMKPLFGSVQIDNDSRAYMMHQRYTNFNWLTCIDNVLIAVRRKRDRRALRPVAEEILNRVGLGEYINQYPTIRSQQRKQQKGHFSLVLLMLRQKESYPGIWMACSFSVIGPPICVSTIMLSICSEIQS